jgi:CRISPR-associated endonuclease/helicase Cas3
MANEIDSFSDEDDPSASGTTHWLLDDHRAGVARLARQFADLCALPPEIATIIEAGGEHHDLGKADPRFQAWLKGGNPWAGGPLLAKSAEMAQGRRDSEAARERAHYPKGGRHELVSVRLLESRPDLLPQEPDLRDLLLHLVASHHGHCRPFAPVVEDGVSRPVEYGGFRTDTTATGLERIDSGVAERFWRLTRRYGWWGLAWLEALVRLADHRRSEFEETVGRNKR